jgi:hypothetical protein
MRAQNALIGSVISTTLKPSEPTFGFGGARSQYAPERTIMRALAARRKN